MTKNPDPWAPYEPSADDPWDLRKAAHLYRRAGFGPTRAELQDAVQAGPAATVGRLLRPRPEKAEERQIHEGLGQGAVATHDGERLKAYWLYRMLHDVHPLREKLTLFWHSHFATSDRKVQSVRLMLRQNELLRSHALGSFAALATALVTDPAMLVWLDGADSKRAQPNENFAREFLELFTLGPGHYSEADIRQAARAFAGWVRIQKRGETYDEFRLDPAEVDDGIKTFLGQTGPWKPADVVRITLEQPAAVTFLCRKLVRFFVQENAETPLEWIQPLADEFRAHDYDVTHVAGIILRSRHFHATAAYRQRIKGPVEFSVGLCRSLELPRSALSLLTLAVACARQGQDLFHPPNVKGWDGGKTWIDSSTVLERGNWVTDVIWGNGDGGLAPFNPRAWAAQYGLPPERTTAALVELLLQDDLDPAARALVLRTGADGQPDSVRKALQLLLHCPEYQLA